MSYFDFGNYEENKTKIPYDDIPINRNERFVGNRNRGGVSGGGFKLGKTPTVLLSIFVIVNFIVSIVCVFMVKNIKSRVVNQYTIQMTSSSGVSAAVKNSAYLSAVCVAAGGSCSTESAFYNSTLSRGSGVIYKIDGNTIYFVTCYHVISGYEDKIWVMLPTSVTPLAVSAVAYSSHYDLAVLKYRASDVEYTLGGATAITVFDSVYTSLGENVFAIGNSLSSGLSITEGVISQINTQIRISTNGYLTRALQTSAEINPGNSGGGLFNAKGKFIGLVNAKRHSATSGSETYTVVGTSYAIPSSLVCGIADKMIKNNGKPTYINLGVTFDIDSEFGKTIEVVEYDGEYRQVEDYSVIVGSVSIGSVAYQKLRVDDVIESIEFYVYENDVQKKKTVQMFNEFTFEDYSFSIVEGSTITFNLQGGRSVDIVANAIATVSD